MRLGVGVGIGLVHVAADGDAPFGGEIGEADIDRDGAPTTTAHRSSRRTRRAAPHTKSELERRSERC